MAKVLPESKFRTLLEQRMRPHWAMTWHEDREISPGVPDLHYVITSIEGRHQVGWLELKAMDVLLSTKHKIGVEPSQHQYIRRWEPLTPIHFLVRIVDEVYLVKGKYHKDLPGIDCETGMRMLCDFHFHYTNIPDFLPGCLAQVTKI